MKRLTILAVLMLLMVSFSGCGTPAETEANLDQTYVNIYNNAVDQIDSVNQIEQNKINNTDQLLDMN